MSNVPKRLLSVARGFAKRKPPWNVQGGLTKVSGYCTTTERSIFFVMVPAVAVT